jgi:hypothetical protein
MQTDYRMFGLPLGGAVELEQFGQALGQSGIPYVEEALSNIYPTVTKATPELMPQAVQGMLGKGGATVTAFGKAAEPEIYGVLQRTGLTRDQIQEALRKLLQEGVLRRITGAVPVNADQIRRTGVALGQLSDKGWSSMYGPWTEISSLVKQISQLLR